LHEAVIRFNHEDDTYEVVKSGHTPDLMELVEEYQDYENHPELQLNRVERILDSRQGQREDAVTRFLSDL